MIINFIDRKADVKEDISIGNRGDANVTTLQFILPRVYEGIDLAPFIPSIEWQKATGAQDELLLDIDESNTDPDTIILVWLLPEELLATAGNGTFSITFISDSGEIKYKTDDITVSVVDTIDVDGTIIPTLPESYRTLLIDVALNKVNITQNVEDIAQNVEDIILKANIEQEAWIKPTMLNGTVTLVANAFRYYKDTVGKVYVTGTIQNSDGSNPCVQLIDGYKSAIAVTYFPIVSVNDNAIERGIMLANGQIYIKVPDDDTVYVNLIFKAE